MHVCPNTPACIHVSNMPVCVSKHTCMHVSVHGCVSVLECIEHRMAAIAVIRCYHERLSLPHHSAVARVRFKAAGFPSQTTHLSAISGSTMGAAAGPRAAQGWAESKSSHRIPATLPRAGGGSPSSPRMGFSWEVRAVAGEPAPPPEGRGPLSFSWASHALWRPPHTLIT